MLSIDELLAQKEVDERSDLHVLQKSFAKYPRSIRHSCILIMHLPVITQITVLNLLLEFEQSRRVPLILILLVTEAAHPSTVDNVHDCSFNYKLADTRWNPQCRDLSSERSMVGSFWPVHTLYSYRKYPYGPIPKLYKHHIDSPPC